MLSVLSLPLTGILPILLLITTSMVTIAYAQEEFRQREFVERGNPEVVDSYLRIEEVVDGLDTPTTMAFLGINDFLVLEKDKGTVQRVVDGKILDEPLLDANVANSVERCMCGIAISKHDSTTTTTLQGIFTYN